MKKLGPLRSYKCSLRGRNHWTQFNARSIGQAKIAFYHYLDGDFDYLDIRCRVDGEVYTSDDFIRNAEYRNIPLVRCGMVIDVNGRRGIIVGHNSSANLDVLFDDGSRGSCHPNWKTTYFKLNGDILYKFA